MVLTLANLERRRSFALLGSGFSGILQLWLGLREGRGSHELVYVPFETPGDRPRRFVAAKRLPVVLSAGVEPAPLEIALDDTGYAGAIASIRRSIAAGDVYQVCCTVRADLGVGSGAALFAKLARRGLARFAAWVRLPDHEEIVSASPELMFETLGRRVRAEPMKGTAAPGTAAGLVSSEKDEAELAMITDLVRSDLASACVPRSVRVPCERRVLDLGYALQTVSDVEAALPIRTSDLDVLAALHPGGSVTGAPKIAALRRIRELEPTPRGAYCGVLGVRRRGRGTYALLIRTASRLHPGARWVYGVGGGIVWDSDVAAERRELRWKLGALGPSAPPSGRHPRK